MYTVWTLVKYFMLKGHMKQAVLLWGSTGHKY